MNALEKFYKDLDESGWDIINENDINTALQKVNDILKNESLLKVKHFAEIDRQAFHFNKSPEKRLSPRTGGTRKMQDGSEIPFEWPDIREFNNKDFDYLYKRFKSCKNIYAKTEYGLVLFYSKKKQDNTFVIELLTSLFELLKIYIKKARPKEDKDHYILYSRIVLAIALHIANNRKSIQEIENIYKSLIEFTFKVHQSWDITHSLYLRTIIDYTDFAVQYFTDFEKYIKVNKFIEKNWEASEYLSDTNILGAIYVANSSIKLCRKLGIEFNDWLYFKAKQYEKLSVESRKRQDLVSISFIEDAMSIYKNLKDEKNLNRLQKKYQSLRTEFRLGEVSQEMPQEETQRLTKFIKKEIKEKSEEEIVKTLMLTPMISPLTEIKKWNKESNKETLLQNMIPVSIIDKFGNTIARYISEDEMEKYSLLRTYEFHIQIAIQTILQYFIEALRSEKISANIIISLLSQTWMGKKTVRRSNGSNVSFSYIKMVESGINSFFNELLKWKADSNYFPNFVSATDSLVLKAEYFLREFCVFLNIPTFKSKDENIIMERTLDDILRDERIIKALTEDDHFFIKYILIEKAGYNLRNQIAHGLMDDIEYDLQYPLFAIIIILKLSNYQFSQKNNK